MHMGINVYMNLSACLKGLPVSLSLDLGSAIDTNIKYQKYVKH